MASTSEVDAILSAAMFVGGIRRVLAAVRGQGQALPLQAIPKRIWHSARQQREFSRRFLGSDFIRFLLEDCMKQRLEHKSTNGRVIQTMALSLALLASQLLPGVATASGVAAPQDAGAQIVAQPRAASIPAQVAPAAPSAVITTTIVATQDARIQAGSPDNGFGNGFIWVGSPNGHLALVQFDLLSIPISATINNAVLSLDFQGTYSPTANVEVGRNTGEWDEDTVTWNTKPGQVFGGPIQSVGAISGTVNWNVTGVVAQWHSGSLANDGFALRGDGPLKAFHSKETTPSDDPESTKAPRLKIAYTIPDDANPHPDLGDAPDSSNNKGLNNVAYLDGTLGNFPTVWQATPAGQPAGPHHNNNTGEGILGDALSREVEADVGPDSDGPNNILNGNVISDSNRDRADDGWRNRNAIFADCTRTNLVVRVRRAPGATLNHMFLNVWFDGSHDGDWNDNAVCQPDEGGGAGGVNRPSTEWIVQDRFIDMTAIPAGGFVDLNVPTEFVLNSSPNKLHWLRFTLSERRAMSSNGRADGRGPNPNDTPNSFDFGETEDYLQKPAPAGENGQLQIMKTVQTGGQPIEWIDYVTYTIRLRQNGGTQPTEARLRDVLPYPLIVYPTIDSSGIEYIVVSSPTGGVAPLTAQLEVLPPSGSTPPQQVVKWQGTLAPDAEVQLQFKVRTLNLCNPGEQTRIIQNTVEAKPKNGTVISDTASYTAKCIDYDESGITFEQHPITNVLDTDNLFDLPLQGLLHNRYPFTVTTNLYQDIVNGAAQANAPEGNNATTRRPLQQVVLPPNGTVAITVPIQLGQQTELGNGDVETITKNLGFCLVPENEANCPDVAINPAQHGQFPITFTLRPNDLGDAPDSSNHAGVNMQAYPGPVTANFPTVFDPALGLPQGPRHGRPRPFHLGPQFSREGEADLGPDQDAINNIVPAANNPDNDVFDDGTNLALWNLTNCQTTTLPVQVAIGPAAVAYFAQQGTPGYINIWIDGNRDGDWADFAQCGNAAAPEHVVIDAPINVVGLGVGLHNIAVPTGLLPWATADKPAWVRITLSERPSNKTLTAPGPINYGDGRGFAAPFLTGETEDYYYRPNHDGPDVAVQLVGKTELATENSLNLLNKARKPMAADKLGNFEIQLFKIDYQNIGSANATNSVLEFQIPEKLRDMEIVMAKGTDVAVEQISFNFDRLTVSLPDLKPGHTGSIILGWYGCITCTLMANAPSANAPQVDYTGNVNVTAAGDVDTSNNTGSATIHKQRMQPTMGSFMDYTDDSCMDRVIGGPIVTNQSGLELRGKAEPNSIIAILIGLLKAGTTTSDANGNFSYNLTLPEGRSYIHARYENASNAPEINSPRDVASGQATGIFSNLPFNPMSACVVDSKGRSMAIPSLGFVFHTIQWTYRLQPGETYTMSVEGKPNTNQSYAVTFEDVLISSLTDEDGDGVFKGSFTLPNTANMQAKLANASASLGLLVTDNNVESSFSSAVSTGGNGVIRDRNTGNPLANASVAALIAQTNESGESFFTAWLAAQGNPQTTGADGQYSFNADSGVYRLDVSRSGYQPYRSENLDVDKGSLNQDIALTPAIAEAAAQKIYITASGFQPASVKVNAGAAVEFINMDVADHAAVGSAFDSGALAPGASFKVKLNAGSYTYTDGAGSPSSAVIQVDGDGGARIFLPMLAK